MSITMFCTSLRTAARVLVVLSEAAALDPFCRYTLYTLQRSNVNDLNE